MNTLKKNTVQLLILNAVCMCVVYFMTSNEADSYQMCVYKCFHAYENERVMKEW